MLPISEGPSGDTGDGTPAGAFGPLTPLDTLAVQVIAANLRAVIAAPVSLPLRNMLQGLSDSLVGVTGVSAP